MVVEKKRVYLELRNKKVFIKLSIESEIIRASLVCLLAGNVGDQALEDSNPQRENHL